MFQRLITRRLAWLRLPAVLMLLVIAALARADVEAQPGNQILTQTSISTSTNPVYGGQSATLNINVSGAGGTPSGSVTIFRSCSYTCGTGFQSVGSVALINGQATFDTGALTAYGGAQRTYTYRAIYGGDTAFAASESGELTVGVQQAPTMTVVTVAPTPSTLGQSVTFTVTVTALAGHPDVYCNSSPGIALYDGQTLIAESGYGIRCNQFSFTTNSLAAGTHNIKAVFTGGTEHTSSTSPVLVHNVTAGAVEITITPTSLPVATRGFAVSTSFAASGGVAPYSYALAPGSSLPTGVTLSPAGVLGGVPTQTGTFNFTVRATDSATGTGPYVGQQAVTLTVNPAVLTLTPATLSAGTVAQDYGQTFEATGGVGSVSFSLASGTLPAGLSFSSDGVLSGTPTAGGSFTIEVQASDEYGNTGSRSYTLLVQAPSIAITPTSLPAATRGIAVNASFAASGGVAPYSYALAPGSSLPTGVTLSPAGVLGGVPTQTGTFNFTVRATDSATGTGPYVGQQEVTLTVNGAVISLTPANLPDVLEGRPYAQALTASGGVGPYTFAVSGGALPEGVTLSSGGVLSGTPNAAGVFSFDVTATDAFGNSGAATMTLAVSARPNPALSADIRGLLSSEDSLSQRFAWTQLGNFHARFDSLRSGGGNGGGMRLSSRIADGAFAYTPAQAQGRQDVFGASFGGPRRFDGQADGMFGGFASDYGWNFAPGEIEGSETSLGLASGGGPIGPREAGSWEFWTGGTIGIGRRDAVDGAARFDFQSEGISAGLDLKLSDRLAVGLGGGFGRERVDIGSDGSTSRAHNGVAAVYGTFTPIENLFVDAVVGGGALSFDLKRYDASASGFAEGTRDGTMRFASLSFGINRRLDRLNWQAFGRIEHLGADLDAYTETGAGIWSLSYLERSLTSTAGALGASASMNGLKIGTALFSPRVRLEWRHEFDEAGSQGIRYADWVDSPIYTVTETGLARDQLAIGLGAGLYLDDDWSVAADLSGRFDRDSEAGSMRLEVSRRF